MSSTSEDWPGFAFAFLTARATATAPTPTRPSSSVFPIHTGSRNLTRARNAFPSIRPTWSAYRSIRSSSRLISATTRQKPSRAEIGVSRVDGGLDAIELCAEPSGRSFPSFHGWIPLRRYDAPDALRPAP